MRFHTEDDGYEQLNHSHSCCHCKIRGQRDSVRCTSIFSGRGIIKTVPSLDFPYGGVALIPNCFSIKLKVLQVQQQIMLNESVESVNQLSR